jgi:hypothetical protein
VSEVETSPRTKKRWSEYSPGARAAIVVGAAVEAIVTAIALRDIIHRSRDDVRGPKLLWVLGCFVQPVGAPLYLLAGRRRAR